MEDKSKEVVNELVDIYNRERIDVSGVIEVLSSTDREIFVKLKDSFLQIVGEKMTITKLVPEQKLFSVSGRINGLNYSNKLTKKSFFGKVFKWCF